MENINDRIILIMNHYGYNTNSFSEKIKVNSSAVIHNIIKGRRSKPSFEIIAKILFSFENINPEWFILGTGSIFKNSEQKSNKVDESEEIYFTCKNCKHQQQIIDLQKQRISDLEKMLDLKDQIIDNIKN